ncbi:MAG TPA: sulfotransferase [Tepidisphaeraceae bacterium]|nr:sulfotransferase [Tepidisphaeraceae bacterium]
MDRETPSTAHIHSRKPKSGTTAIAALLAAATAQSLTRDFAGAEQPFVQRLLNGDMPMQKFVRRNAWAFSSAIIKEPTLTFVAPALLRHFPDSPVVFIVRNPFDNLRSMLVRQKLRGDLSNLPTGIRLNPTWRKILAGTDLRVTQAHYINTLAHRWLRAINIFQEVQDRCLLIRYEDFNEAKVPVIAKIAGALNLPVVSDVTPLANYAFQRRDALPISTKDFFGANYARIEALCGSAYRELNSFVGMREAQLPKPSQLQPRFSRVYASAER